MAAPQEHDKPRLLILIPSFNDWGPLAQLLLELDEALEQSSADARVLIVDDASTEPYPEHVPQLAHIAEVSILPLRRNLGHQRAIAIGLAYVEQHLACDAVVVMDGDGEDAPTDVPRLVTAAHGGNAVVFAERTRRAEGTLFRALYLVYRAMHWLLTGRGVRVGNFSIVPRAALQRLVAVSELWNHYAGAVFRSRIPYRTLPTQRRKRIAGKSHMSFVSLVTHGLSAMSVQVDVIGVRLLMATALGWLLMALAFLAVVGIRLFTSIAIPGWASTVSMLLIVLMTQSALLALGFVFMTLQARAGHGFIPLRDYVYYTNAVVSWQTQALAHTPALNKKSTRSA